MADKKYFDIGDLVWAKMKSFPFWPAMIVQPPTNTKSAAKKARHYVFFFGSENYAWIQDQNIVHHSEEMLQSASKSKKMSNSLKLAIKQITEEAPKKAKFLVKVKVSPEASTSGTKKKTAKVRRIKQRSTIMRDYTQPKIGSKKDKILVKVKASPEASTSGFKKKTAKIRRIKQRSTIIRRDYTQPKIGPIINLRKPNKAVIEKNVKPTTKKIGFIGLGMMGQRHVKNLLTTNHKVFVWNRTFEKCIDFARAGAQLVESPYDMVRKCDVIFCCLSDYNATKNVLFGDRGILSGLERSSQGSKVYVEMTTMDPTASKEISKAINLKGGRYMEATLTGSLKMAEDGAMLLVSAGDQEVYEKCLSTLNTFADDAYHLSFDIGSALKVKIIHSALIAVIHAAFAEAIALVEHSHLSRWTFLALLKGGPLYSRLIQEKKAALKLDSFPNDTSLKYLQKDLQLTLSLDTDSKHPMIIMAAANEVFKRAKLQQYSDIFEYYSCVV